MSWTVSCRKCSYRRYELGRLDAYGKSVRHGTKRGHSVDRFSDADKELTISTFVPDPVPVGSDVPF